MSKEPNAVAQIYDLCLGIIKQTDYLEPYKKELNRLHKILWQEHEDLELYKILLKKLKKAVGTELYELFFEEARKELNNEKI